MSNIIGVFDVDLGLQILLPFTQDGEAIRTALAKVTATRPGRVDPMHTTDMRSLTELGLIGNASGTSDDLTIANQGLKDYNFSVPGEGGVLVSSSPAGIVTQTYAELQRNSATTVSVSGLTAVVAGLSRAPGRKSLVLFTEGVAISRNTDPYFYALIDQANRANVAIYTVDSVGLRAEDPILMAGRQVHSQTREDDGNLSTRGFDLGDAARAMPDVGLTILADQTGGQMFNASNDLFKAFPRLDEDLRSYYAVTYAAPRAEPDRRFHKIDVKVKRPGLSAKTRSGYTSLPAATGSMPVLAYEAPALARLDSTPLPNELPIMARALVFPVTPEAANVPVLVSVPANVLDYTRDAAAGTFAAEAVVLTRIRDDRGQVVHKASEQYTLNGKMEGLEASRAGELLFYRQPQLAPGVYTFEAIVMDTHSGKASVRISSLEVAHTTGNTLRVGTPFIVRRAEPASASAADAGNPLYFGDVLLYPNLGQPLSKDTDKELAFGFTAYDGHGESIEGSLEILRSGQPLASVALALGAPDKHGRINQISRLPLEALAPGSYELRVILTSGQQRVTRSVRFALVGS
jgi:VWFA-related protein